MLDLLVENCVDEMPRPPMIFIGDAEAITNSSQRIDAHMYVNSYAHMLLD